MAIQLCQDDTKISKFVTKQHFWGLQSQLSFFIRNVLQRISLVIQQVRRSAVLYPESCLAFWWLFIDSGELFFTCLATMFTSNSLTLSVFGYCQETYTLFMKNRMSGATSTVQCSNHKKPHETLGRSKNGHHLDEDSFLLIQNMICLNIFYNPVLKIFVSQASFKRT